MANVTIATIRQRFATAIDAVANWQESRIPYDLFPHLAGDTSQYAHRAFAVGAMRTEFGDPSETSIIRRGARGARVDTTIGVRWTYRIRADGAVADYDNALTAEATMLKAAIAISRANITASITDITRQVIDRDGESWWFGEAVFNVRHQWAIQ